jgi:hypothetical protein
VNWWLAEEYVGSRWRLQELPDGHLSLTFSDMPMYGRCYAIFHNRVQLGRLEIHPYIHYSAENPNVVTEIELHSVRLLSYESVAGFLSSIAMHTCDKNPKDGKPTDPSQVIVATLTKALWETQRITEFADLDGQDWGDVSLQFNGLATDFYFTRREALRKKRADASDPGAQLPTSQEIAEQARGVAEAVAEALGKQPRP